MGFGNLPVAGADFTTIAESSWPSMPLSNERMLVGSGRFDYRPAKEYLFRNPNPTLFTARTPVATQHNDNNRTGAYLSETTLTPAAVQAHGMGLAATYSLDDVSLAEPLYLPDLVVNGVKKDVVLATTASGSIYPIDANDTTGGPPPKWSLQDPENPTGRPARQGLGITGTPMVDMGNELLYVLYQTADGPEGNCWDTDRTVDFRLAAVDIHSGAVRRSVRIDATYPTTNHHSSSKPAPRAIVRPPPPFPRATPTSSRKTRMRGRDCCSTTAKSTSRSACGRTRSRVTTTDG